MSAAGERVSEERMATVESLDYCGTPIAVELVADLRDARARCHKLEAEVRDFSQRCDRLQGELRATEILVGLRDDRIRALSVQCERLVRSIIATSAARLPADVWEQAPTKEDAAQLGFAAALMGLQTLLTADLADLLAAQRERDRDLAYKALRSGWSNGGEKWTEELAAEVLASVLAAHNYGRI